MKRIAEYGTVADENMSRRTVLKTGKGAFDRPFELLHKTEGYEPAGSCLRYTKEAYGAISYNRDGTRGGQWFLTLAEAETAFNRWTTPVVEQKAGA
ncbi:MAG: hypothetical protein KGJ13_07530 [Patescibacteria group bacterium]|nr:hypothetical protein [Patescibacteria group bacterium]